MSMRDSVCFFFLKACVDVRNQNYFCLRALTVAAAVKIIRIPVRFKAPRNGIHKKCSPQLLPPSRLYIPLSLYKDRKQKTMVYLLSFWHRLILK